MILAEIRMTYRSPAFYGETLMVESRVERIGRTSFGMVHRITAPESRYGPARLIAVADSTLVSYNYREECPIPVPDEWRAGFEAFEGRSF
jgi:acyl-CoA thioester hydrolase